MMFKSELIQAGYGLASYHQGIQITDQSLRIQMEPIYSVFFHAHPVDFEQKGIKPCVRMQFQLNEFDDLQEATLCPLTL